ncbi:MAG: flagellar hook-associated protein FlgK [Spirochaetota bacterium]|jgi:flagellar hook-associated protein 1 FlgK|nr:flagellar hook-associated protein FlgK [Spirochaetota bacterium]
MLSTFHGIEVGKRGLQTHQQGLHVVEHNIANMNTEGYSRQRITFEAMQPLFVPGLSREETPGQIGMGGVVQSITRVRNEFIDDRIMEETSNLGYWQITYDRLHQIEQLHNESSEETIRNDLDQFWKSWEKLNINPDDHATRAVVRETGITLSRSISKNFDRLFNLQTNIDTEIQIKIEEINAFARQIAELSDQIRKSEQIGDNPNDLWDKRDLLVEKLSSIINVNVVRSNPEEYMVYIGSQYLVQGSKFRRLAGVGNPMNDGFVDVKWDDDRSAVKIGHGGIAALLELRDVTIADQIREMDNFTLNLTDLVNEVHRDGFGLNFKTGINFFQEVYRTQNRNANYDYNGIGRETHSMVFRVSGTKAVDLDREIGSEGQLNFGPEHPDGEDTIISYTARDTVREIIDRINRNDTGVVAYANHRGRIALKANLPMDRRNENYVIRHIEDSGDFLVGITGILRERGQAGAFDWRSIDQVSKFEGSEKDFAITPQYHLSRWMDVDIAIKRDLNSIAAAQGIDTTGDDRFNKSNGFGDGNNALVIAGYRYGAGMIGDNATFDEFFTSIIGRLGSASRDAKTHMEKSALVMKHLENNRKSLSGVSEDEELSAMLMFQHGYNASARLIRTLDSMLDTLINRLHA